MTNLILRTGDMFTSDAPALAHGVNIAGVMGAGVAKFVKQKFPDAFLEYRTACWTGQLRPGGVHIFDEGFPVIYNVASQDLPGPHAKLTWLDTGIRAALTHADLNELSVIALPRIGCGIGGLDWADVEPVLRAAARDHYTDLEVWEY
jgi:O-acetyl-ADP-ribose deacetylase (regulator of RNase III)